MLRVIPPAEGRASGWRRALWEARLYPLASIWPRRASTPCS